MSKGSTPRQRKSQPADGMSHLLIDRGAAGEARPGTLVQGGAWAGGGGGGSVAMTDSAELAERVEVIKNGVDPGKVEALAARLGWPKERLLSTLGLARATIDRRIREKKALSPEEGGRVLGLERLVDQVQRMVEESGDPEGFDAGAWVGQWLSEPVPALGGRRPAEYMDTSEGQQLVARIIAQIQSGAYS